MPEARLDGCLQWADHSSGHTGCNRSAAFISEGFYCRLTQSELRARMQCIVDFCDCHASKQSHSRDRGLVSSLPIPYCAKLYINPCCTRISSTVCLSLVAMIVVWWSPVV